MSLSSDDALRDILPRDPPSVSSSCLPSVVPSLFLFTGPFPSSELDPVCVRTAARWIDVDERENDCSNGFGSSSNFDLLSPAAGAGRIGGRWRTAGSAEGASSATDSGVGGRIGISTWPAGELAPDWHLRRRGLTVSARTAPVLLCGTRRGIAGVHPSDTWVNEAE